MNMLKSILLVIGIFLNTGAFASVQDAPELKSCLEHPDAYASRSAELQDIYNADQADREGNPNSIDWSKISPRDLARRARVAEIFAEGCFKVAKDYANAAMVYQHGQTPDHFFQTFVWAKKAVDLGDSSSKWLMAAGLDRYLVHTGQKQLFATQGGKDDIKSPCWCLEPVETSFPTEKQIEYTAKTVADQLKWIQSLNEGQTCGDPQCKHALKPSPAGTVPGFW
jgi:hypothetical protein